MVSGGGTGINEAWRFTPNGDPNYSIEWSDDSGNIVGDTESITVSPEVTTTYRAKITYTNCDLEEEVFFDETTVVVNRPYNIPDLGPNQQRCEGTGGVVLDATASSSSVSYQWFKDGVLLNSETSPQYTVVEGESGLYSVTVDDGQGCVQSEEVQIDFVANPTVVPIANYTLCDIDGDGEAVFDLTSKDVEIADGQDVMVSYHLTQNEAENGAGNLMSPYQSSSQVIWVRMEDVSTGCRSVTSFNLVVATSPMVQTVTINECDDASEDGYAVFDLTTAQAEIVAPSNEIDFVFTYYHDSELNSPILAPDTYTNTSAGSEVVYVSIENAQGCSAQTTLTLSVNSLPPFSPSSDMYYCEVDTDEVETIPLTEFDNFILEGADGSGYSITYHLNVSDAENGISPISDPFTNTSNPQQLVARVEEITTNCYKVYAFNLHIASSPQLVTGTQMQECDTSNGANTAVFDLMAVSDDLLSSGNSADFEFSFYTDSNLSNQINSPSSFTNTSNPQMVYVRARNRDTGCEGSTTLELEVLPKPFVALPPNVILCSDDTNGVLLGADLGNNILYQWNNGATTPTITVFTPGDYYVLITDTMTGCIFTSNTTSVSLASVPDFTPEIRQSPAFMGNHTIEVVVRESGDYEYRLDNGMYQMSGVFTNVVPGQHFITIRERNGCGELVVEALVLDYLRFFTPNGDGYTDNWNIIGLENQPSAEIYLFDRYGKFIKQLDPTGPGWDGTYNGRMLPSTDYWFKVIYTDPSDNSKREFRSHFSLKR